MKRLLGLTIAASILGCGAAWAQVSDGVVKFGVLNDMSSLYADFSGKGGGPRDQLVASQASARQPVRGSVAANWHPSAIAVKNEEVFCGDQSRGAT
ncbi:MAG: hypothetical protein ACLPKT_23850 [Methylocella sp.]